MTTQSRPIKGPTNNYNNYNNNNDDDFGALPKIQKQQKKRTESSAICRGCKDDQNLRSFCFQNQFRKEARQRSGQAPKETAAMGVRKR